MVLMMPRTLIKICGLTTAEQTEACIDLGLDWIGFNCYPKSKRYVTPEKICQMMSVVPDNIVTVGVFVNESAEQVVSIMQKTGMHLAQLHGDETPNYTKILSISAFKAFRVSSDFSLETISDYPNDLFLLDAYHESLYGGSGVSFDWEVARKATKKGRLLLAGGLTPENVENAVTSVRPFGVDVCSGVEVQPGLKDLKRVQAFISAIRQADQTENSFQKPQS